MPYMYCGHTGCNETVHVPNKYCPKHARKKAKDLSVKLDTGKIVQEVLADKGLSHIIEPKVKTKKTTK